LKEGYVFCWSKWYFCYFFFELVPLEQKPTQKRPLRRFSAFQVRFVDFFPQIWVIFEKKLQICLVFLRNRT
jgi:hypothetical protein